MSDLPFQHLTIIGLGLIGGSLAMAARERFAGMTIRGVDIAEEPLQYALKSGVIDEASRFVPTGYAESHLILLAAHLGDNQRTLRALAPLVADRDVLVSDIGSCKRQIYQLGQELLPSRFLAGHPMAGKEFAGIQHATSLLYAGKSYLLCPPPELEPTLLDRMKRFVEGIGAIPRTLDPERHDRYMAYVSHLPQLYSILLTNLLYRHEPGHLLSYHGGGIDDQLRLAASPYPMWRDIFIENQDNLRAVLDELGGLMRDAATALDTDAMAPWFERSNHLHQEFHTMRLGR